MAEHPTSEDLGTGQAARAAEALKKREERTKASTDDALDAFRRAAGLPPKSRQSTDSNQ